MSLNPNRLTADEWQADINRQRRPRLASLEVSTLDPLWRRFRSGNQGARWMRHAAQPLSGPHQTQPSTVKLPPAAAEATAAPHRMPVPRSA
jgi:hypothetical protein